MKVEVIDVKHNSLSSYIQSFLFISSSGDSPHTYTTFPNTNLCLSIYFNNDILYTRDKGKNLCQIKKGSEQFTSRLYGFHEHPFSVEIASAFDQICILFHPGALRAFTKVGYDELHNSKSTFDIIFPTASNYVLEQVFLNSVNSKRAEVLETFLLSQVTSLKLNPIVLNAMAEMNSREINLVKIDDIAQKHGVNTSTLYRLFLANIGQNPKSFLNTIRFRKTLKHLIKNDGSSLTSIAYLNSFHDQAHFNKEIKRLSGFIPSQLRKVASIEQDQLAWVAG